MPRGSNPNSRKNLIANTERTPKQIKERNSKAGKESGKVRSAFKSLNEDLREQLTPEIINQINQRIISLAKSGNLKAYELIRNGIGEDPTKKMELSGGIEYANFNMVEYLVEEFKKEFNHDEKNKVIRLVK